MDLGILQPPPPQSKKARVVSNKGGTPGTTASWGQMAACQTLTGGKGPCVPVSSSGGHPPQANNTCVCTHCGESGGNKRCSHTKETDTTGNPPEENESQVSQLSEKHYKYRKTEKKKKKPKTPRHPNEIWCKNRCEPLDPNTDTHFA